MSRRRTGRVYLVGGGPGDPGLLTLRGQECLARADVVLYDYLVNPLILAHAPQAEHVCLGRHGRDRILDQAEINQRLVALVRAGRTVVRLKGGDPGIFAHLAEEVAALMEAGIEYEIVPGITAAWAAASYAGIPITRGDQASAVALITGQQRSDHADETLDYGALAAFPGTLVFYMGVTTARRWTEALLQAGKPADTPAAIVVRCSWPDQQTIVTTLAALTDEVEHRHIRPPALVIVGDVVSAAQTNWFAARPLFGVTVLVTRPREQAESLRRELAERGARVLLQPAIEISPPDNWSGVDTALMRLPLFDWIVFSSCNGVRAFIARLLARGLDLRALGNARLAAIGPGTSDELAAYHLKADLMPGEYRAEALTAALSIQAAEYRYLLVRASRGREVLAEQLTAAGGVVEQAVAYASRDVLIPDPEIAAAMALGQVDWVTVTSSAIARSLVNLFGDALKRVRLASISPVTSATLRRAGFAPAVEATEYTMAGVVAAILRATPHHSGRSQV